MKIKKKQLDMQKLLYKYIRAGSCEMLPKDIKDLRKKFKMTQLVFAELLGVSYGTYKNWEIGHRSPCSPAASLLQVAKKYPKVFLNAVEIYNNSSS